MATAVAKLIPDNELASWEDPGHPLFQEMEEQLAATAPPPPPLEPAAAIAEAIRLIAQPSVVGYHVRLQIEEVLRRAGL